MPGSGFGRCDGHHEMVDFRLRKMPWVWGLPGHPWRRCGCRHWPMMRRYGALVDNSLMQWAEQSAQSIAARVAHWSRAKRWRWKQAKYRFVG